VLVMHACQLHVCLLHFHFMFLFIGLMIDYGCYKEFDIDSMKCIYHEYVTSCLWIICRLHVDFMSTTYILVC